MGPLLFGLAFGLYMLGGSEVRRFEHDAARDIRAKLQGERAQVSVKTDVGPEALFGDVRGATIHASAFSTEGLPLFTEPWRSHRGVLHRLTIDLSDFTLRGLHVARLRSAIPDCRFDLGLAMRRREIRLSHSGEGRGDVEIGQDDLAATVLRKFHEIKRVTVSIAGGRLKVDGYGEFVLFKSDFSVDATLTAVDGTKLCLADARILLGGKRADPQSEKILVETLNPVIDLDVDLRLHGAMAVERIDLEGGVLRASGRTRIPDAPTGNASGVGAVREH